MTPLPCAALLSAPTAAASTATQHGQKFAGDAFGPIMQDCPALSSAADAVRSAMLKAIDDKILCTIMCCCSKAQADRVAAAEELGETPDFKRQTCVEETLKAADKMLGYQSRYKAEVTYDMTKEKPTPFMHRDPENPGTTEPSNQGQFRAPKEIPGYKKYNSRRPDVVIVKDPTKPPTQDNIERVVEMKFKGNYESDADQYASYEKIAGDPNKFDIVEEKKTCKCGKDGKPEPDPYPYVVPFANRIPKDVPSGKTVPMHQEDQPSTGWRTAALIGLGALVVVAGVVTIAAAIGPGTQPAALATGEGTAVAATAFGAAWTGLFAGRGR